MIDRELSVYEVNHYIKTVLANNSILKRVRVHGEISNFKHHSSGHMYFSIKDDDASLACVMFKSDAAKLNFIPENGMDAVLSGRIDIYERSGQVQLYVRHIKPSGVGELYRIFEQRKDKLSVMGWFDEDLKKPIPEYPSKIGIATSPTGAAVRDLISVIKRRNPAVDILLAPCLVQGVDAAESVAQALKSLDVRNDVDVIIVGRGGGSMEDLWAFNEMAVLEAIHEAKKPVISAVGHETDFTLSDFTADMRAPTPSAAAELSTVDMTLSVGILLALSDRLSSAAKTMISERGSLLNTLFFRLEQNSPRRQIERDTQYLDILSEKMWLAMKNRLATSKQRLHTLEEKLKALDPKAVLNRGFAIVTDEGGRRIAEAKDAAGQPQLTLTFADGNVKVTPMEK